MYEIKNISLAVIAIAIAMIAPNYAKAESYIGINAGILSSRYNSDYLPMSSRTGFEIGIQYEKPFNEWFSFLPELRLEQKGTNQAISNVPSNIVDSYVDFLELPLLEKFSYSLDASFKPYVLLGPYFAEKIFSGSHVSGPGISGNVPLNIIGFNSFDFGFIVGAGSDYQINNKIKLSIDFEYEFGFANADIADSKTRTALILLGLNFAV